MANGRVDTYIIFYTCRHARQPLKISRYINYGIVRNHMTDWAKSVHTLRTRLRLKQGALANLIGVSQTYISRLEAGTTKPAPRVALALRRLEENPRTRSVFDDFLSSVRHSPYRCAVLDPQSDGRLVIIAASNDMTDPQSDTLNTLEAMQGAEPLCALTRSLIELGIGDGAIAAAHDYWLDQRQGETYWRTQFAPLRDGTGASFVHLTLIAATKAESDAHLTEYGNRPAITTHGERAAQSS
jgi:transcriptional regulator with XRE-family HTH domain